MSKPQNPLNYFRTYSYHHILVVCDGTDTAEALAKQTEITVFDHESADKRFCPQRVRGGNGKYVVLINGTSDAQFTIKSAKWASVLIPNEDINGSTTHFSTMAVDGEIVIQEILGVNFLNVLNEITKSLGTDPNGVCFLLKTIFVGHRDDGSTETITNVKPLMFLAYDVGALFDVTGAEYTVAFVGIVNGAAQLPHTSAAGDGFKFTVKEGQLMLAAMKDLEKQLNDHHAVVYNKLVKQAECRGLNLFKEEFYPVEYEIRLDKNYHNYSVGTAALSTQQDKNGGDVIIAADDKGHIGVEALIEKILKTSQEILDDPKKSIGDRTMFKITSTLETGPEKYKVVYHVHQYVAAVVDAAKSLSFTPPPDPVTGDPMGIEFDYIFTGKNVDVKTFDLKMQMGMAFLQTLATASSLPTNANSIIKQYNKQTFTVGTGNKNGPGDQQDEGGCKLDARNDNKVRRKPLFLGSSLKSSDARNSRDPIGSAGYNALLARHAAFENIEARIVIRGNPQLLEETTQLPQNVDTDNPVYNQVIQTSDSIRAPADERPRQLMPSIHKIPGYVKVNVRMPTEYTSLDSNNPFGNDATQPFWYTGWFFLYSITHSFDDGDFTQELEMFSLPTDAEQMEMNTDADCGGEQTATTGTGGAQTGGSGTGTQTNAAGTQVNVLVTSTEEMGNIRATAAKRK